ncbi:MAG: phosphatase PAP2 family protein [Candidatus Pacearchaeota archaeon]
MKKKRLLIISLIFLALFCIVLGQIIFNGLLVKIDNIVNSFIPEIQNPIFILISTWIDYFFNIITIFIILLIISVVFLLKNHKRKTIILSVGFILITFITSILKYLIHRARPLNNLIFENDFSYPSGHVSITLVFFGLLLYLFWDSFKNKKEKIFVTTSYCLVVVIVAFSRVYLNVHWLSDIIGSIFIGLFTLFMIIYLDKSSNKLFAKLKK